MGRYSSARVGGFIEITDADGGVQRSETERCVHCQAQWVRQPGSGKLRGFCFNCNGMICGPDCERCIHWEKKLEIMEGTAQIETVSVGMSVASSKNPSLWLPRQVSIEK